MEKIWDDKKKVAVTQAEIVATDFVEIISLLDSYAAQLSSNHSNDTVPGRMANSLVGKFGYKNVKDFMSVNVDHPF